MLRCISVFFVVFICWACEVDYSFGEKDFKPRVVVNALISPQEPFAAVSYTHLDVYKRQPLGSALEHGYGRACFFALLQDTGKT